MKKIFFLLLLFLLCSHSIFASPPNLEAYLSHSTFAIPGEGPYLETYLEVRGNSLVYNKNSSGKFQGSVLVTLIIRQDTSIVDFKKYELHSPMLDDTVTMMPNFIDQQRFLLTNGNYTLEVKISDAHKNDSPIVVNLPVEISVPDDAISISGIQMIESFSKTTEQNLLSKSGYDFIPYVDNFFPTEKSKLTFYAEIYNPLPPTETMDKFLVSAHIESFESKKMLNDYVRIKREDARPVIALFSEFDISRLPSGNYNLVISVRDKQNLLLSQNAAFFQRFNSNISTTAFDLASIDISNSFVLKFNNLDTLRENIRSLAPVATEMERIFINSQLMNSDKTALQQFFYNFWANRNEIDPSGEWEKYRIEVIKVNNTYATQVKKGYETDMGRVYLQYGPPNTISDAPFETAGYVSSVHSGKADRGSIPYQIWHYYTLNNNRERNKKFVFINSGLRTTDYQLVHSDAKGEIQNYNWQRMLSRDLDIDDYNIDSMKRDRSRSAERFNNPF